MENLHVIFKNAIRSTLFLTEDTPDIGENVKETVAFTLINLVLPSINVYFALVLAINYFSGGYYEFEAMVLLPLLLNYLACWYIWATKDNRKAITWVAPLLGFYPQFVTCKLIWLIWTGSKKGFQEKKHLDLEQLFDIVSCIFSPVSVSW